MKSKHWKGFKKISALTLLMLPRGKWIFIFVFWVNLIELAVIVFIPLVSANLINAIGDNNWIRFKDFFIVLGFLTLFQASMSLLSRYLQLYITEHVGNSLRTLVVNAVFSKRLVFFEKNWTGDIIARSITDTNAIKAFPLKILLQIIVDSLTLCIVVTILFWMNPILALITIAFTPLSLVLGRYMQPRIEASSARIRQNISAMTSHLQSWLIHPAALKAYRLDNIAKREFNDKSDEFTKNIIGLGVLGVWVNGINVFIVGIPSLIILGYGGYITFKGQLTIGELFAFITYTTYFQGPISRLIDIWIKQLPAIYPIYQRIQNFLNTEDIDSRLDRIEEVKVTEIQGKNLKFYFGKAEDHVLDIPLFNAKQGEIVGIMGPNGSGKSTLLRLVAGIIPPHSGEISITDFSGQTYDVSKCRYFFSFVLQDPVLFEGNLIDNITLFDKKVDMNKLTKITEKLKIDDWISSLSQGWQTKINPGLSKTFSGGQMQSLSLTRLFYQDSPILFLDEPENNLDQSIRAVIPDMLKKIKSRKILLWVFHDKKFVDLCDRLYQIQPVKGETGNFRCFEVDI